MPPTVWANQLLWVTILAPAPAMTVRPRSPDLGDTSSPGGEFRRGYSSLSR
ncbi:hypothetical protein AB0N05_10555 [Nocardia sp. NPDC051030]|uniref:hypothetical protein n=1 Tax=Nocardia sp. NPDC051030 TaxID=3155162 RepID=UPI003414D36C